MSLNRNVKFGRPVLAVTALVWVAMALVLPGRSLAANGERNIFSVKGIGLDVRARTAIAARERAIAEAEIKGFGALLYKLLDHDDPILAMEHPAPLVRRMVRSFEVGEEKTASGRYIATYHLSYDPQSVREYLGRLDAAFSEIPGDRLLVMPTFERFGATLFWEEENPWWEVMTPGLLKNYLLDYVVPDGGFDERLAWSAAHLARGPAPPRLRALLEAYAADDVLLLRASAEWDDSWARRVMRFEYRRLGSGTAASGRIFFLSGDDEAAVLRRVFRAIAGRFDASWKERTQARYGGFKTLAVEALVGGIEDWVRMRRRLEAAAMVRSLHIETLALPVSQLQIRYLGSEEQLRLTLEQVGLRLANEDGTWRLSELEPGPAVIPGRPRPRSSPEGGKP